MIKTPQTQGDPPAEPQMYAIEEPTNHFELYP